MDDGIDLMDDAGPRRGRREAPGIGRAAALGAGAALLLLLSAGGCQRTEEPSFQPEEQPSPGAEQQAAASGQGERPAAARSRAEDEAAGPAGGATAEGDTAAAAGAPATTDGDGDGGERHPALLDPSLADERAPDEYTVELDTTAGPVRIDVDRSWAPRGADRFYNLVKIGYFEDVAFFRVIEGFMAQGGIHGDPQVTRAWRTARIPDDPPTQSNTRGMVTFATSGPNSRTTQFFINFVDNSQLDQMGFAPFGKVQDMEHVDELHAGYGEGAPRGRGPSQGRINAQGNAYLRAEFPELDYIESARIVEDGDEDASTD